MWVRGGSLMTVRINLFWQIWRLPWVFLLRGSLKLHNWIKTLQVFDLMWWWGCPWGVWVWVWCGVVSRRQQQAADECWGLSEARRAQSCGDASAEWSTLPALRVSCRCAWCTLPVLHTGTETFLENWIKQCRLLLRVSPRQSLCNSTIL